MIHHEMGSSLMPKHHWQHSGHRSHGDLKAEGRQVRNTKL